MPTSSKTAARLATAHGDRGAAGYICLREDGVFAYGAVPLDAAPPTTFHRSAAALAVDARREGCWVASRDGHVTALGVPDVVGADGVPSASPIIDLVSAPVGRGLWALDAVGGVFAFGSAKFHGSVPGLELEAPVEAAALASTATGDGYWVLDRVGGVFCFGDAAFYGSLPGIGQLTAPAVALLPEAAGDGYVIVLADGTSCAFGRATELDPVVARHPIVAATKTPDGALLVDVEGIVYPVGLAPFLGSPAALAETAAVVDITWWGEIVSE